jgi:hypothetical protein
VQASIARRRVVKKGPEVLYWAQRRVVEDGNFIRKVIASG